MASPKLKLYFAVYSPFAQRVWIALNAKKVDFELIRINPRDKPPGYLSINPRGLVPAIVDTDGRSMYESAICVEYIDETWPGDRLLLPGSPYDRSQQRLWGDHITKKIIPHFYAFLMKQTKAERKQEEDKLVEGLRFLFTHPAIASSPGPFLVGRSLTYVDVMLAPFGLRFETVLKRYRNFEIPATPEWSRYHQWIEAIRNEPSIQATMADVEQMIQFYGSYVNNTNQSKIAEAIRKGEALP